MPNRRIRYDIGLVSNTLHGTDNKRRAFRRVITENVRRSVENSLVLIGSEDPSVPDDSSTGPSTGSDELVNRDEWVLVWDM